MPLYLDTKSKGVLRTLYKGVRSSLLRPRALRVSEGRIIGIAPLLS